MGNGLAKPKETGRRVKGDDRGDDRDKRVENNPQDGNNEEDNKVTEIACQCGGVMKRTTYAKLYGPDAFGGVTCDGILENGKRCMTHVTGENEFFRCSSEKSDEVHGKGGFDYCLACAGVVTRDEYLRVSEATNFKNSKYMAEQLEKYVLSNEQDSKRPNLWLNLSHMAWRSMDIDKAEIYAKKAFELSNQELITKLISINEKVRKYKEKQASEPEKEKEKENEKEKEKEKENVEMGAPDQPKDEDTVTTDANDEKESLAKVPTAFGHF